MKIISNYKDYYDYLAGVQGIDEKIVYERIQVAKKYNSSWVKGGIYKPLHLDIPETENERVIIAICGTVYTVLYDNGNYFFGSEIEAHIAQKKKTMFGMDLREAAQLAAIHQNPTKLNNKYQCPVLRCHYSYTNEEGLEADLLNIRLSDWRIGKILPDEEIWLQISQFLSKEKPIIDSRTDKEKIEGHGFDYKKSFRKM